MPFDDDHDDEREGPDRLLPPDDRLWRHPSEIGAAAPTSEATPGLRVARRFPGRTALAGACLAGAVVVFGAMWITRPTKLVEQDASTQTVRSAITTQKASFSGSVPTKELAEELAGSVVLVRVERAGTWSNATGLWVDDRGTVAVAAAAVADASTLLIVGQDQRAEEVQLAGVDPMTGVAALIGTRSSGRPVSVADRPAAIGDAGAVIGANGTDAGENLGEPTVSVVVVRSVDMRATIGDLVLHDAVELDRPIPGDAHGGALVDVEGNLLGMVAGNSARDLGAAVPGPTLVAVASDLRDEGKVRRAWLGVRAVDLDPDQAGLLAVPGGARLTEVTASSPAATAGLERDDVVTDIGGHPIGNASDLVNDLARHEPGDRTTITVRRGGKDHQLPVELGG